MAVDTGTERDTDPSREPGSGPDFGQVSRLRGRIFEGISLAASVFGLVMLAILLVYVVIDAFGLDGASPGWLFTYGLTLVVPYLAFCLYSANDPRLTRQVVATLALGMAAVFVIFTGIEAFVRSIPRLSWPLTYLFLVVVPVVAYVTYVGSREPVGRVGFGLLGRLLGGAGLGFALVILFVVFEPIAWFWAYTFGVLPAIGLLVEARQRPTSAVSMTVAPVGFAGLLVATSPRSPWLFGLYLTVLGGAVAIAIGERRRDRLHHPRVLAAVVAVGLLAIGATSASIGYAPEFILAYYLGHPGAIAIYVWSLVLPVLAALVGLLVRQHSRDVAILAGGLAAALVAGAGLAGPVVGISPAIGLLFGITVAVPVVAYGARVVDNDLAASGLLLPAVILGGILLGTVVVSTLGVAGPDRWLDASFLTNSYSQVPERAGFFPAIVGSVLIIAMVAVFSFVLAVGTAVFLEEYTPDSGPIATLTRIIQINIANLAAVPSVVYGLLGLGVFINLLGFGFGAAITAALTLSLLILPITIITAQEAIRSVPDSMRNGSYAMGATRWQTTKNVVLPEAFPGILTGTILSMGRAIGETAPLIMIGAPTVIFNAPDGVFDKATAMPMQIYVWSDAAQTEFQYGVLAAGVVTLLVVLLGMNAAAIILRNRAERQ